MPAAFVCIRLHLGIMFACLLVNSANAQEATLPPTNDSIADMESIANSVDEQLSVIAALLKSPESVTASNTEPIAVSTFSCESLRPATQQVYHSAQVQVDRIPVEKIPVGRIKADANRDHNGHVGLSRALNELKTPMIRGDSVQLKFKTIGLQTSGNTIESKVVVHFTSKSSNEVIEQSAQWIMDWSYTDAQPPRLQSIRVDQFEQVRTVASQGQWYVDCTEDVFAGEPSFADQLGFGTRHWRSMLTAKVEIGFEGHTGISVADVNNDDREDVFVCQVNGLPNRLYLQQPDGTLKDVSAQAGVDILDSTRAALFLDFDNDGDQDLACAVTGHVLFLSNDGQGKFQVVTSAESPQRTYSISAADYDQDGDLDVYACGYIRNVNFKNNPLKAMFAIPTPYHDARNGAPNILLRNDGDLQFTDATIECGLDAGNNRFSHASIWEDFDNDGDQDLYVANDFGRNNFYRNDNGAFTDISAASQTEDIASGMGLTVEDFDKDGWMDIHVSNMFSAAGNRTTQHQSFKSKSNAEVRGAFRRHARGNTLFRNLADGTFADISEAAGITLGRWAWSSNFVDMNNNGWHDLFVGNGYVTNEKTRDL